MKVKDNNKEFLTILKKVRLRLGFKKAVYNIFLFLSIGLGISLAAVLASRFVPIYNLYIKLLLFLGALLAFALLFSIIKAPSLSSAALCIDSYGLSERTITALEIKEENSPFAEFQKEDALQHLKSFDYKKNIKLIKNSKYAFISLGLFAMLSVMYFIPNPMKDIAIEKHKLSEIKKEEINKVKKVEKELAQNEKLKPFDKNDLQKKLSTLKEELKEAKDEKEINKAIEKADKKLEMVKSKYDKEELKKLADTLEKNELTKKLAKLINLNNTDMLKQAVKTLSEQLKNLNKEQIKELAENMSKLSKELKNNEELKNALSVLAQKMAGGELGDISSEMEQFAKSLEHLMNSGEYKKAVAQMQRELNDGEDGAMTAEGSNSSGGGNSGNNGIKPGQGQGRGSSGAGGGTDMGEENPTPTQMQNSGLNKKDGSERKEGEYEKIFTPKTLGGQGEKSQLTGKKNNSGTSENVNSEKGINVRGESVPYNKVIGSYKQSASQSMESSSIPEGMKDIIKNYFTSLEE